MEEKISFRYSRVPGWFFRVCVFAAVVAAAFWLGMYARDSEVVQSLVVQYGYAGIFLMAVASGFNIIIPIPAALFIPVFLESGFSIWPVIGVIALGTTIADLFAYGIGRAGRHVVLSARQDHMKNRLDVLRQRFPWAPIVLLFLFAALAPFPNEFLVVPLAFLGYRMSRILPPLLLGNGIFNTLSAFGIAGVWGIW